MIDKRQILDAATALGLTPHVVEKDYVLGWLLWGVANHEAIADTWTFKGGTCLKKCFFETYRFSEDLDFTLADDIHLDEDFLRRVFADIADAVYDRTGIEVPTNTQRFDLYRNPRGKLSCQARIAYRGPVSPRGSNMPRVKFDLTADELLVLPAVRSSFTPTATSRPRASPSGRTRTKRPSRKRPELLPNAPGPATSTMSSTSFAVSTHGRSRLCLPTCFVKSVHSKASTYLSSATSSRHASCSRVAGRRCSRTSYPCCPRSRPSGTNYPLSSPG